MKILVDADSCPRPAREAVVRASARTGIPAIFAANRPIPGIVGDTVVMEVCPPGKDSADNRIFQLAQPGDLALTRDIPLAGRLVGAEILVLDDRGQVYTKETIRERLSLRDFMVELGESGLRWERVASYGKRELKAFADSFDRILTRLIREAQLL
ncbi:MAG: DUF188 domain-containing protein [Spirochaetaceae bacterium]|nr:DUF188 domain-containing protein [Spirochaetaceae bacterium]